ncbi:hypothetical protein N9D31_01365 [Oligoflexaceae bacterium]|nr:hypothetical protein [Oligoflexaceae bacterium]
MKVYFKIIAVILVTVFLWKWPQSTDLENRDEAKKTAKLSSSVTGPRAPEDAEPANSKQDENEGLEAEKNLNQAQAVKVSEMTDEQIKEEIRFLTQEIDVQAPAKRFNQVTGAEHQRLVKKWRPVFESLTQLRAERLRREIKKIGDEVAAIENQNRSRKAD